MSVFGYFQRHEEKRRETNSGRGMMPPLLARVPAEKVRIIRKRFPNPRFLKRITAAVLGSVMLITSLCGFGGFASVFAAGGDGPTQGVTLRQADPSTMDTYLEMLDLLKDTRYAGRLWTDKSVFAKGQKISVKTAKDFLREFDGEKLKLVKELDGLDGKEDGYIKFNSDFLEVFSALSSGEVINENVPLDVMFLLDVSGSMGSVIDGEGQATAGTLDDFQNGRLPINTLVKSLNAAIGQLLKASPESRIGITIYGSTAAVLLPLGHYTQNGERPFLTEKWIGQYGTTDNPQGVHFRLTVEVKENNDVVKRYGDNAGCTNMEAHSGESGYQGENAKSQGTGGILTGDGSEGDAYHVGHITNPQAGLAAAMDQFITGNKEISFEGSNKTEYLRIPALMHITDGQATDIAWIQPQADQTNKDEWTHTVSNWNNVNLKYDLAYNSRRSDNNKYNTSQLSGVGAVSPVIFQTLMTAAYYKSAVNAYYNSATVKGVDGKPADLQCYSVYASNDKTYGSIGQHEIQAAISAILDPLNEFKDVQGKDSTDSSKLDSKSTPYQEFIDTAYELYKKWKSGQPVNDEFSEKIPNIRIQLNASQDQTKQGVYENKPGFDNNGKLNITSEDVEDNINYVQYGHFQSSNFENLSGVISGIVQGLTGTLFAPVTGTNDLGVSDSLTFMDPMGKYMEVKNVTKLLLFGKLYDMVRAGVYNYQFVSTHRQNPGQEGSFQSGWYHMNSSGEWLGDVEHKGNLQAGLDDRECYEETKTGGTWEPDEDGSYWEYYLNSTDARKYVSTLPDEESIDSLKANNPAQYRKFISTTYTFYRVNVKEGERAERRMNPAYGPDTEALSEGQVGVYTLNDLRVWVEDTGSYSDDSVLHGGLHTDTGYDRALWINIPRYMLPLRTVTLTQDDNGGWTYKSNMEEGSSGYPASFPIRIFYEVGVSEDILTGDGHINTADVSAEYVKQNKSISEAWSKARGINVGNDDDDGVGSLEFFSNWYNPENRYGDYVTSSVEYSYGDPAATFSPSSDNRYYIFQQALPLYRAAYRYDDGGDGVMWKRVGGKGSGETNPGGSDDETNLAEFGGKIVAADLEISVGEDLDISDPKNEKDVSAAITNALNSQNPAITPKSGEVVLLKDDRLTDVTHTEEGEDPFPSDAYYFVPIDYFELQAYDGSSAPDGDGDGTGTPVRYCVARKGSEFGSAYQSSGIKNGDMLCWYDASGANDEIYPYHSFDDTGDRSRGKDYIGLSPEEYTNADGTIKALNDLTNEQTDKHAAALAGGDWTVAAKPGALRVGDLAQAVGSKVKDYTLTDNAGEKTFPGTGWAYNDSENGNYYREARFPDKAEDDSFTIQYYNGNITRTANNYYLPTISLSAGEDGKSNDIVVDVYLGNNGRLTVADTALLLTKTVKPAESGKPFNTDREFSFNVTIKGRSGEYDAVVVKADDDGNWHRQLNYADVMTDSKLFLLNTDGTKALADINGKRVILTGYDDESGEPKYAYEDGTPLPVGTEEVYYVFIGSNTGGNAMRVYQNPDGNAPNPDRFTEDSLEKDILTVKDMQSGGATYSAKSVWLFTQEQYASFAPNEDGNYADESGAPVSQSAFTKKLTTEDGSLSDGFPLLKLSFAVSDNGSEVTDITVESDYGTNSPYWAETVDFVKGTARVTLKHGYGLLFTGIPMKNQYTVTENLSDEDAADGYSFESLTHMQGTTPQSTDGSIAKGSTSFFESAAHYVNTYITGSLGVKKEVVDDDKGGEFKFKVTLTVPKDLGYTFTSELLTVKKTDSQDTEDENFKLDWTDISSDDDSQTYIYTAEFTLQHGEKVTVSGIPLGSSFTVVETERDGYNLQGVKKETASGGLEVDEQVNRTDDSISGNITQDGVNISYIFRNGRAAVLPFTGGLIGAGTYIAAGLCLLAAAFAVTLITRRRGRHEK